MRSLTPCSQRVASSSRKSSEQRALSLSARGVQRAPVLRSATPQLHGSRAGSRCPSHGASDCHWNQKVPHSARASPVPMVASCNEEDAEAELLLASARSRKGVRLYPFVPHSKSVVDQVVFGHDIDESGENQFEDPHFLDLFQDRAGRASWKSQLQSKQMGPKEDKQVWGPPKDERSAPILPPGRRKFHGSPLASSVVDDIVFGHDIDQSGNDEERFESMLCMHTGAAGAPSWIKRPEGIGSTARTKRFRQAMLRRHAKQFSSRLERSMLAKSQWPVLPQEGTQKTGATTRSSTSQSRQALPAKS
eukprot:TRINITY_DN32611_c0_g1_i1.p1 TRINITY_DN32611_c0_g1~~TRINITY_DN32611_c0_g1_i1.p1  ORF type:complete len:347 (-),score=46.19 TRINITY_DN32611_c0_g1_i1:281-1195(-)